MVFKTPEVITKFRLSPRAKNSVNFRPSRKLKITPQTMPKGRPFKNKKTKLYGKGTKPNATKAISANTIRLIIKTIRFFDFNSAITFIPMTFESIYPKTCEIIKIVL